MEIIWHWNFLETLGAIVLVIITAWVILPIVGIIFLNGKFKGWW